MITSVTIEGFKSFGTPSKPITLGPLNFIVGANASGKTNFVSALRFLHLAVTDGLAKTVARPEFDGPWGIRNQISFSKKDPPPLVIAIRAKGPFPEQRSGDAETFQVIKAYYNLEIGFDAETAHPYVQTETLEVELQTSKGNDLTYSLRRVGELLEIKDPLNIKSPEHTTKVPESVRSRLAVEEWSFGSPALWFNQWVSRWRFFGISPNVARLVARESSQNEMVRKVRIWRSSCTTLRNRTAVDACQPY